MNDDLFSNLFGFFFRLYSDYLYFHVGTEKSQADFHNRVEETISDFLECSRLKSARYCAYAAKDVQVIYVILAVLRPKYFKGTGSLPWLLMLRFLASQGHQR